MEHVDSFTTQAFSEDFKEALGHIDIAEDRAKIIIKLWNLWTIRKNENLIERRDRLIKDYGLSQKTAEILAKERSLADNFECTNFIYDMKKGCIE